MAATPTALASLCRESCYAPLITLHTFDTFRKRAALAGLIFCSYVDVPNFRSYR